MMVGATVDDPRAPAAIDVSLAVVDPLEPYRLFDARADAAAMTALLMGRAPTRPGSGWLLVAPAYFLLADGIGDVMALNDFVTRQAEALSGCLGGFGVVEPRYGEVAAAEIERMARNGLTGVVWSPRAQGVFADASLLSELVRHAHRHGLLSMLRCASGSSNEALWRIWQLARRLPELPILVSGALQNWDNAQMILQAEGPANLFYDTAGWTVSTGLAGLAGVLGPRLLHGTGGAEPPDRAATGLVRHLRRAGCDEAATAAVLCGNAERLLGLGRRPA